MTSGGTTSSGKSDGSEPADGSSRKPSTASSNTRSSSSRGTTTSGSSGSSAGTSTTGSSSSGSGSGSDSSGSDSASRTGSIKSSMQPSVMSSNVSLSRFGRIHQPQTRKQLQEASMLRQIKAFQQAVKGTTLGQQIEKLGLADTPNIESFLAQKTLESLGDERMPPSTKQPLPAVDALMAQVLVHRQAALQEYTEKLKGLGSSQAAALARVQQQQLLLQGALDDASRLGSDEPPEAQVAKQLAGMAPAGGRKSRWRLAVEQDGELSGQVQQHVSLARKLFRAEARPRMQAVEELARKVHEKLNADRAQDAAGPPAATPPDDSYTNDLALQLPPEDAAATRSTDPEPSYSAPAVPPAYRSSSPSAAAAEDDSASLASSSEGLSQASSWAGWRITAKAGDRPGLIQTLQDHEGKDMAALSRFKVHHQRARIKLDHMMKSRDTYLGEWSAEQLAMDPLKAGVLSTCQEVVEEVLERAMKKLSMRPSLEEYEREAYAWLLRQPAVLDLIAHHLLEAITKEVCLEMTRSVFEEALEWQEKAEQFAQEALVDAVAGSHATIRGGEPGLRLQPEDLQDLVLRPDDIVSGDAHQQGAGSQAAAGSQRKGLFQWFQGRKRSSPASTAAAAAAAPRPSQPAVQALARHGSGMDPAQQQVQKQQQLGGPRSLEVSEAALATAAIARLGRSGRGAGLAAEKAASPGREASSYPAVASHSSALTSPRRSGLQGGLEWQTHVAALKSMLSQMCWDRGQDAPFGHTQHLDLLLPRTDMEAAAAPSHGARLRPPLAGTSTVFHNMELCSVHLPLGGLPGDGHREACKLEQQYWKAVQLQPRFVSTQVLAEPVAGVSEAGKGRRGRSSRRQAAQPVPGPAAAGRSMLALPQCPITCLQPSPGGVFLAIGCSNGVLAVFDFRSEPPQLLRRTGSPPISAFEQQQQQRRPQQQHRKSSRRRRSQVGPPQPPKQVPPAIQGICWSADNMQLASLDVQGTVSLYCMRMQDRPAELGAEGTALQPLFVFSVTSAQMAQTGKLPLDPEVAPAVPRLQPAYHPSFTVTASQPSIMVPQVTGDVLCLTAAAGTHVVFGGASDPAGLWPSHSGSVPAPSDTVAGYLMPPQLQHPALRCQNIFRYHFGPVLFIGFRRFAIVTLDGQGQLVLWPSGLSAARSGFGWVKPLQRMQLSHVLRNFHPRGPSKTIYPPAAPQDGRSKSMRAPAGGDGTGADYLTSRVPWLVWFFRKGSDVVRQTIHRPAELSGGQGLLVSEHSAATGRLAARLLQACVLTNIQLEVAAAQMTSSKADLVVVMRVPGLPEEPLSFSYFSVQLVNLESFASGQLPAIDVFDCSQGTQPPVFAVTPTISTLGSEYLYFSLGCGRVGVYSLATGLMAQCLHLTGSLPPEAVSSLAAFRVGTACGSSCSRMADRHFLLAAVQGCDTLFCYEVLHNAGVEAVMAVACPGLPRPPPPPSPPAPERQLLPAPSAGLTDTSSDANFAAPSDCPDDAGGPLPTSTAHQDAEQQVPVSELQTDNNRPAQAAEAGAGTCEVNQAAGRDAESAIQATGGAQPCARDRVVLEKDPRQVMS